MEISRSVTKEIVGWVEIIALFVLAAVTSNNNELNEMISENPLFGIPYYVLVVDAAREGKLANSLLDLFHLLPPSNE